MTWPGTRSRLGTAFLLVTILVLGISVVAERRKEARLRAALARFQARADQNAYNRLNARFAATGGSGRCSELGRHRIA